LVLERAAVVLDLGFEGEEMDENPGEFQVGDCYGAVRILGRAEIIADVGRPWEEPDKRFDVLCAAEPYPADSPFGRVHKAPVAGIVFDEFLHVGGAATGLVDEGCPIGEEVADVRFDFDAGGAGCDRVGDDAVHWS
jgi:hypothetical protein